MHVPKRRTRTHTPVPTYKAHADVLNRAVVLVVQKSAHQHHWYHFARLDEHLRERAINQSHWLAPSCMVKI